MRIKRAMIPTAPKKRGTSGTGQGEGGSGGKRSPAPLCRKAQTTSGAATSAKTAVVSAAPGKNR